MRNVRGIGVQGFPEWNITGLRVWALAQPALLPRQPRSLKFVESYHGRVTKFISARAGVVLGDETR